MQQTIAESAQNLARNLERANAARSKPITTTAHGVLDYTLSPTLTFAPQTFGFPRTGAASAVPRVYGAASMIYSSLTEYELGLYPVLPMKSHLILDAVSAVFMAVSPWLLSFGKRRRVRTWLPHLAFAATELAIVAFSDDRSKA